jgi:ribokinase
MARILVIGYASRDTVHIEATGQTISTIGGAGLYTAVAIRAAGTECTLLAPRLTVEDEKLARLTRSLTLIGPTVNEEDFPALEIVHHGNDNATLKNAKWAPEGLLSPDLLPDDINSFDYVHIAALNSAELQLAFLKKLKGHFRGKISAGTHARAVQSEGKTVQELMNSCDCFFMNENEAKLLSGSDPPGFTPARGQMIVVTRGKNGAAVVLSNKTVDLKGVTVDEVDPTGAGDTFCGTMLGAMARGMSIEISGLLAVERSALVITAAGSEAICRLLK